MIRRMQGVPAHITYLKKKDEGTHRTRCIYFTPKNLCKYYSQCRGSVDCAKYKEIVKEEKKKNKRKSKINQDTIKAFDNQNEILLTLTLVEQNQSDVLNGKISIESPLGKAVLGKRKGDIVEVFTDKKREYRITSHNKK